MEGLIVDMNTAVGIIGRDAATVAAVLAAVNLVGVEEAPLPTPQGELGGCVACGHTVRSHFGADGRFLGCLKGEADTVFVLVPAKRPKAVERRGKSGGGDVATAQEVAVQTVEPTAPPAQVQHRGMRRARYFSAVHHRQNIDNLPLSETRRKVLKAVHRVGKQGVLARQVMARTKLPHGTVQQTLNWLRTQKNPLVIAEDAAAATPAE